MTNKKKYRVQNRQKGVALLVIFTLLFLGSASLFFSTQNLNSTTLARQDSISRDLQKAKQGLIAFAVNYADYYTNGGAGPGHLPCADAKDTGDDDPGSPASSCKANKIGRLPTNWKTNGKKVIELYPFARTASRRFWYLPSSKYRYCCGQNINPDEAGELRVDNIIDVIAVIIDPGPPLPGQTRPSDNAADYLEDDNADGDENFVTSSTGEFNDRIVYITRTEIMTMVQKRVLDYVYLWLKDFENDNGYFPYPTALGDPAKYCEDPVRYNGLLRDDEPESEIANCGKSPILPNWFIKNGWQHRIYYHVDRDCVYGKPCNSAGLSLRVNGVQRRVLVASVGIPIVTGPTKPDVQNRVTGTASVLSDEVVQYLDSDDSVSGDNSYSFVDPPDEFNNDLFMTFE